MHINAWGGHIVDPGDPSECRLAEPEAMVAMEWIRARMWDDKAMATPVDVRNLGTRDAFVTGAVAMVEDGSWALKDILTAAPFRVGVAVFPAGPAGRATLATTDGFGIYSKTNHPDEAWELLKFLVGKEYGSAMARANFLQPARASLVEEWTGFIRDELPAETEGVDIAAFADGHLKGYAVTAEVFDNMNDAKRIAYDAWDRLFTLGQTSVEQMDAVCAEIEAAQQATE